MKLCLGSQISLIRNITGYDNPCMSHVSIYKNALHFNRDFKTVTYDRFSARKTLNVTSIHFDITSAIYEYLT